MLQYFSRIIAMLLPGNSCYTRKLAAGLPEIAATVTLFIT